jgi:hypothetical protein
MIEPIHYIFFAHLYPSHNLLDQLTVVPDSWFVSEPLLCLPAPYNVADKIKERAHELREINSVLLRCGWGCRCRKMIGDECRVQKLKVIERR